MTQPKCRIEPDHGAVIDHLILHHYPVPWNEAMLAECAVVRVYDDAGTVGYFWGHWVSRGTMSFHVCADRPVWVRSLPELYQIAFWLGADFLVASLDGHPSPERVRSLLLWQGFTEEPALFFTKSLLDEPDEFSVSQAEDHGSDATGPAASGAED